MRKFVSILLIASFFLVLFPKINGNDIDDPKSLNGAIIIWNTNQTLTEDITIKEEDTLIIEPGVTIKFGEYVTLKINGTIIAIGTKNNMVNFIPISSTDWFIIELNPTNNSGRNIFQFCNFVHMSEISCHGGNLSIMDNKFINVSSGIWCRSEFVRLNIQNNSIKGCRDGMIIGVSDSEGYVINNTIHGSDQGVGIFWGPSDGGLISKNKLINCGTAITMQHSNVTVIDNVISNNYLGISWKGGTPLITKNTIINSTIGLLCHSSKVA